MNILKRPMFFAAIICSVAAAMSLFYKSFSFVFIACAFLLFLILVFLKKYQYITVAIAVLLFSISLFFEFVEINKIEKYDNQIISGKFFVVDDVEKSDDFNTFTLKLISGNSLPENTNYFIFDHKKTSLKMGDIVSADIKISAIDAYDEYRLYDYGNGVYATASAKKIEKTGDTMYFIKRQEIYVLM